jgi:deazaflavin-dependent oxidoreductase (nitroreductase family)
VPQPDLVAMNAAMTDKILDEPVQPYREGGYALRVVRTTGRRSGQRRSTPLGVVQVDSALYLVSPDRGRHWVRNVESDPHLVLDPGGDPRTAVAAEPAKAALAVSAYLQSMRAPWALQAFPVGPDARLAEIIDHLDTIAVYRLDGAHARHGGLA